MQRIFPRFTTLAPAAIAAACAATSAHAYTFDDVIVETWAGSGDNQAMLVTDFGDESFAFGYHFDDQTISGEDLLFAIQIDVEQFSFEYTPFDFGMRLDSIQYGSHVKGLGDDDWIATWTATDGQDWTDALGVSDVDVTDQAWLGTSLENLQEDDGPHHAPVTPIPEPSSLALLAAGSLAMLRRARRRPAA